MNFLRSSLDKLSLITRDRSYIHSAEFSSLLTNGRNKLVLNYSRLERQTSNKHSSLLGPFKNYWEKYVFWIHWTMNHKSCYGQLGRPALNIDCKRFYRYHIQSKARSVNWASSLNAPLDFQFQWLVLSTDLISSLSNRADRKFSNEIRVVAIDTVGIYNIISNTNQIALV
jgi:hypothetical protein